MKDSYTPELRAKRSNSIIKRNQERGIIFGVRNIYDSYGNLYRSKLEAKFSDLLIKNNISFKYEQPIKLINGRHKIVDFMVGGILIEITGFAYKRWQDDFISKMEVLEQSLQVGQTIWIISYKKHINELWLKLGNLVNKNFITAIEDEEYLLESLKLQIFMEFVNKKWIEGCKNED